MGRVYWRGDSMSLASDLSLPVYSGVPSHCLAAGLPAVDLPADCLRVADLSTAGLRAAGLPAVDLPADYLRVADLPTAGWSTAGLPAVDLPADCLRVADLSKAGWSTVGLRAADLSAADLSKAGWPRAGLPEAGLLEVSIPDDSWHSMVADPGAGDSVAGGPNSADDSASCLCTLGDLPR